MLGYFSLPDLKCVLLAHTWRHKRPLRFTESDALCVPLAVLAGCDTACVSPPVAAPQAGVSYSSTKHFYLRDAQTASAQDLSIASTADTSPRLFKQAGKPTDTSQPHGICSLEQASGMLASQFKFEKVHEVLRSTFDNFLEDLRHVCKSPTFQSVKVGYATGKKLYAVYDTT